MPHSRRLPKIAPGGRIAVWMTPAQRDVLIASKLTPKALGHLLHQTPVREGKLSVRLRREEIDALVAAAASHRAEGTRAEREHETFLRYLEDLDERFAEAPFEP